MDVVIITVWVFYFLEYFFFYFWGYNVITAFIAQFPLFPENPLIYLSLLIIKFMDLCCYYIAQI